MNCFSPTRNTHEIIRGDDFLEEIWQQALGLQVWVLVGQVEHQKRAVVRTDQSRAKGQDALLEVRHRGKAAQLFKGHNGVLQRGGEQLGLNTDATLGTR